MRSFFVKLEGSAAQASGALLAAAHGVVCAQLLRVGHLQLADLVASQLHGGVVAVLAMRTGAVAVRFHHDDCLGVTGSRTDVVDLAANDLGCDLACTRGVIRACVALGRFGHGCS